MRLSTIYSYLSANKSIHLHIDQSVPSISHLLIHYYLSCINSSPPLIKQYIYLLFPIVAYYWLDLSCSLPRCVSSPVMSVIVSALLLKFVILLCWHNASPPFSVFPILEL